MQGTKTDIPFIFYNWNSLWCLCVHVMIGGVAALMDYPQSHHRYLVSSNSTLESSRTNWPPTKKNKQPQHRRKRKKQLIMHARTHKNISEVNGCINQPLPSHSISLMTFHAQSGKCCPFIASPSIVAIQQAALLMKI